MGGNTGEIQIGSKRELYKYINHYAVIVIKASSKIILVQVYIIFALLTINRSSGFYGRLIHLALEVDIH